MDNDNKVSIDKQIEDLHKQVMLFLGDEVDKIHQKSTNNSYNMEAEYAKTKKNHSPVNFLVLFGAFLIVIGTVFFINKYISVKDEEITVSLDEFEDLNLNNLLNTVATAQMNYDNALETKHTLEAEKEAKINNLKADLENEIFVLESLKLGPNEFNRRKSKAQVAYNKAVAEVNAEFESEILLATKQAESYKEQLDEFDSVKVANAQEREKLLNSEKQLRQIEIDKITKSYEARIENLNKAMDNIRIQSSKEMRDAVNNVVTKYQAEIDALDPKLSDIKANLILSTVEAKDDFNGTFKLVNENIEDPEVIKSVKKYQSLYDDYTYLDNAVRAIPQKNSIPSYVAASRSLVNSMSETYINSSLAYYKNIVNQRNQINNLNAKMEQQRIKYEKDIADTKLSYENKLQSEKNAHEAEMTAANNAHLDEIKATKASYEAKLAKTSADAKATLSNMFQVLGFDAMLMNAAGYENIQVSLNPAKADLITAEGLSATIKCENPIPGKIIFSDGAYYFDVEKDLEGNPIEVDFELLIPGTIIELGL